MSINLSQTVSYIDLSEQSINLLKADLKQLNNLQANGKLLLRTRDDGQKELSVTTYYPIVQSTLRTFYQGSGWYETKFEDIRLKLEEIVQRINQLSANKSLHTVGIMCSEDLREIANKFSILGNTYDGLKRHVDAITINMLKIKIESLINHLPSNIHLKNKENPLTKLEETTISIFNDDDVINMNEESETELQEEPVRVLATNNRLEYYDYDFLEFDSDERDVIT